MLKRYIESESYEFEKGLVMEVMGRLKTGTVEDVQKNLGLKEAGSRRVLSRAVELLIAEGRIKTENSALVLCGNNGAAA